MKKLTEESTAKLLRRAALLQEHTGALTRDAVSLSAFIATGGNAEYSRRFAAAAASLVDAGHTPEQLANRLETRVQSRATSGYQRDRRNPDITLNDHRDFAL